MRLSIPLSLLYPSIAPPSSLRCFISEYSLILLFPWSYRSICWCACVFKASLTGSSPNWAWEVFVLVRDWRVWKRKRVRNGERWIRQRERWVGGREREVRRAKAEVWDETEQIRVTVSNKGYDTFSTFTFSSSFPFLFVALFLPSFSPTLHLFLHLSPAFVFPRRPKNRSKKKTKKRMRAYITQANYLFHMSAQINKSSYFCTGYLWIFEDLTPPLTFNLLHLFKQAVFVLWHFNWAEARQAVSVFQLWPSAAADSCPEPYCCGQAVKILSILTKFQFSSSLSCVYARYKPLLCTINRDYVQWSQIGH